MGGLVVVLTHASLLRSLAPARGGERPAECASGARKSARPTVASLTAAVAAQCAEIASLREQLALQHRVLEDAAARGRWGAVGEHGAWAHTMEAGGARPLTRQRARDIKYVASLYGRGGCGGGRGVGGAGPAAGGAEMPMLGRSVEEALAIVTKAAPPAGSIKRPARHHRVTSWPPCSAVGLASNVFTAPKELKVSVTLQN